MLHVRKVLHILRENKLYANPEKCEFAVQDINFLGFRVGKYVLCMDTSKVDVVQRWSISTKTMEVQQYVGFVQHVRKLSKHFSAIAAPLTNLTKAKIGFKWMTLEQDAFEKLKEAVCSQPMLKLPYLTKLLEIYTDASDVSYGVVLIQDGHPVAYESKKFLEIEARWPTHVKECFPSSMPYANDVIMSKINLLKYS